MVFGLLKEKCEYCREAIEKGKEYKKNVKVPGYVGTFNKSFCSEEHAENYAKEIENIPKKSGCC